ncbi:c-type heme family protein [Planctomycetaceae bacterium SH139]
MLRSLPFCSLLAFRPLLAIIALSGCSPNATTNNAPNENSATNANSSEPVLTIVADRSPSEAQRETMLAAKQALFTQLSGRLQQAMQTAGPAAAISVCKNEAPQIAAEVGKQHGVSIGRSGVRLRNPNNLPPAWAAELVEQKSSEPVFVTLSNNHAAALMPIKLQSQCLMCHGPADQIAPVISEQLSKLYPDDKAVGFKEGELRGWFWIELPNA